MAVIQEPFGATREGQAVDRFILRSGAAEAEIITLRYGLHGGAPLAQREIAQRCGISRSYVSRIEKKALEKLRKELEGLER